MASFFKFWKQDLPAGGQSKLAAVFHGLLLFFSILFLSSVRNLIPLAAVLVLLKGIGIGILISIFYILKRNFQNHFTKEETNEACSIILSEEVTFLTKGGILDALQQSKNKRIIIDASRSKCIDLDVLESLQEFQFNAEQEERQHISFINL
ncbi:MAG: hypothetical protein RI948_1721 [Bacteroidota bacterium]|jgi:MFS superfamily sulfate permease-like transporter